jgi:hypothetical protein
MKKTRMNTSNMKNPYFCKANAPLRWEDCSLNYFETKEQAYPNGGRKEDKAMQKQVETITEEQIRKQKQKADIRELQWTEARIEYNNSWPSSGVWFRDIQKAFKSYLDENGLIHIFEVVKLNDTAKDILFEQAKLNKLVSGIVDIYDELPYRPDEGFDIAWRSLEIFMNHHRKVAWPDDSDKTPHLITHTVKDLIIPLAKREQNFNNMWEAFLADIPLSTLKYAIMRCYITNDLTINTQIERVSARAKEILTKDLYDDIKTQYTFEEKIKPTLDVLRKSSMLLQRILKGEKVTVNGHDHQLSLENRLIFVLSCIIYTNRCERFHGDYFSPFKSDRANLDTYAFSYYTLAFSYIYLWSLIWRHCELRGLGEICTLDSILNAAKTMQDRMLPLIVKGKKR